MEESSETETCIKCHQITEDPIICHCCGSQWCEECEEYVCEGCGGCCLCENGGKFIPYIRTYCNSCIKNGRSFEKV